MHLPHDQAAAEAERISSELARRRDRRQRDKAWFALGVTIALLAVFSWMALNHWVIVFG